MPLFRDNSQFREVGVAQLSSVALLNAYITIYSRRILKEKKDGTAQVSLDIRISHSKESIDETGNGFYDRKKIDLTLPKSAIDSIKATDGRNVLYPYLECFLVAKPIKKGYEDLIEGLEKEVNECKIVASQKITDSKIEELSNIKAEFDLLIMQKQSSFDPCEITAKEYQEIQAEIETIKLSRDAQIREIEAKMQDEIELAGKSIEDEIRGKAKSDYEAEIEAIYEEYEIEPIY